MISYVNLFSKERDLSVCSRRVSLVQCRVEGQVVGQHVAKFYSVMKQTALV